MKVEELHLVANGLGAAPLQQDLLDAAGAGHPETLGALQLGLGLHRQRPTAVGRGEGGQIFTVSPSWDVQLLSLGPHLLPASVSSRSKTDLRA